jgi:hypothetical protein
MSNDFYCVHGNHWAKKEDKIHSARQGKYICSVCEDKRSKNFVKSSLYNRRHGDYDGTSNYDNKNYGINNK